MIELMSNAWNGWQNFNSSGKFAALLLISVLFMWLYSYEIKQKSLLIYTMLISILCICPVTAAILLLYQTRFYDYQWLFSMVPMTIVIAFGITIFVTCFLKDYAQKAKYAACIAGVGVLVLVLLCGGYDNLSKGVETDVRAKTEADSILKQMVELTGERQIILWAPEKVMEYAREYDSSICLAYGRNMWDISLNAFTFDTYSDSAVELYECMEGRREISDCLHWEETVADLGINCILLSQEEEETIEEIEKVFGGKTAVFEGCYLWIL